MSLAKQVLIQSIEQEATNRVELIGTTSDSIINDLYAKCRDYFESDIAFAHWLVSPLRGLTPLSFAGEPKSIAKLAGILDGLHYGVFS